MSLRPGGSGGSTTGAAPAPGYLATTHTLSGATYDYTTDTQWAPSGVTVQRSDTGLMTRGTLRFFARGRSQGTLQGAATGLRVQTTTTVEGSASNQPWPFTDNGISILAPIPVTDGEFEVDVVFAVSMPQKAATGALNLRMGIMSLAGGAATALHHIAYFSLPGVNSGNLTREHGFGTSTGSAAQITTSTTMSRAVRFRRRGGVYEVWEGADTASLSRLYAAVTVLQAQTSPVVLVAGISNNSAVAMAGSYLELQSIAVRDRWSV